MEAYQVVDTITGKVVMNFRSKNDTTAKARATRECRILQSQRLELRRHVGPAVWKTIVVISEDIRVRNQLTTVRNTAASHELYRRMLYAVRAKKAERERAEAEGTPEA